MNKLKLILAVLPLVMASCMNDDITVDPILIDECGQEAVMNHDFFYNGPSSSVFINNASLDGDCLEIEFSASGCSGDSWEVELVGHEGPVSAIYPTQYPIRLSLDNRESCDGWFTKRLSFDVSAYQHWGDQVVLKLAGFDQDILYVN